MDFYDIVSYILIALIIILGGYYYLMPHWRGYKNRKQPTITIRATVIAQKKNLDNMIYSSFDTRDSGDVHYVTFRTADGQDVMLTASRETYWKADIGVTGTLTYQGTKCERFDPDT